MISVHELTKRFSAGKTDVLAVDRLTFHVQPGEVYGLLGPNGAGKTTTLRMILGLLKPDDGYAEVAGVRTLEDPDEVKACVGFVSTSAGLYQWLTPRELLLFYGDLYGVDPRTAATQAEKLSHLFGLTEFLDRGCANLSTGQKQRVNLARALMHEPSVMLLDEPTRGLDIHGSKVIFDYVALLREQGKAVIVSTHRLDEAQRLCDRFGLLNQGKLHREGTIEELRAQTGCDTIVEMFLEYVATKDETENA